MSKIENTFAWSHSSWSAFESCPKRWRLAKDVFWGGWSASAPRLSRLAYRCTKMQNVWSLAGRIVHEAVGGLVKGSLNGTHEAVEWAKASFWQAVEDSKGEKWRLNPKMHPPLEEHYYGRGLDEEWAESAIVEGTIHECLANWPFSEAYKILGDGLILESEELTMVMLGGRVPAWVKPDYVVRYGGHLVAVDIKTGKPSEVHDEQMAAYALYVNRRYGEPAIVHLAYLKDQSYSWRLVEKEELEAKLFSIEAQADRMRSLLDPPGKLNKGPEGNFPEQDDPAVCMRCPMFHPCKGTRDIKSYYADL